MISVSCNLIEKMATAQSKKNSEEKKARPALDYFKVSPKSIAGAIIFGSVLGLSAPGFNLWFLAWIGLAPLFLLISSSKNLFSATIIGLFFGTCYNLVYLSWYLGLCPLDWLGFNWWQGWLLAYSALFIVSFHQGLIISIFSAIAYLIPLNGSFTIVKKSGSWQLPAFLLLPILWSLIVYKICNTPSALGVPWSMIEYTQYQQTQIIQAASIIGGIGIGALIVLANVAFACLYATSTKKSKFKSIAAKSKSKAIKQYVYAWTIILSFIAFGVWEASRVNVKTAQDLYILQGNINIDMQKTKKKYTVSELLEHYDGLINGSKEGVMVWTESSVPTYLHKRQGVIDKLEEGAKNRKQDMVIGAMHADMDGNPYNAAYGIGSNGKLSDSVYHKRYLVPFGEYPPVLLYFLPEAVRALTNTPAGSGFSAGKEPVVLDLPAGKIAPLICFECISPEIVASSVREGGELLVNVSDLAWFHESFIGEQMIAFSVFRAIENRRFLAFAANTGPSVIINPRGKIIARSKLSEPTLLKGRFNYLSNKTIFSKWFR